MTGQTNPEPAGLDTRPTGDIPTTNAAAFEHEDLKARIDAAQPGPVYGIGSDWTTLGQQMAEFSASLSATANNSEAQWRGAAGDAARATLSALADWADTTGQGLQAMGQNVDTQATAASTAKSAMPDPVPYDPALYQRRLNSTMNPIEWVLIVADAYEQYGQHVAAREEAIQVTNTYTTSLRESAATMPAFAPPPSFGATSGVEDGGVKPTPGSLGSPGGGISPTARWVPPPATGTSPQTSPGLVIPAPTPPTAVGPSPIQPPSGPAPTPGNPGWPAYPGLPGTPGGPTAPGGPERRALPSGRAGGPGTGRPSGLGSGGPPRGPGAGARGFGPRTGFGTATGFGPGGPRAGEGTGPGGRAGFGSAGLVEEPSTGRPAGSRASGAGTGGAPLGAGRGSGDEDREHRRPSYLIESEDVWGDGRLVAPPVIGEPPPPYYRRDR